MCPHVSKVSSITLPPGNCLRSSCSQTTACQRLAQIQLLVYEPLLFISIHGNFRYLVQLLHVPTHPIWVKHRLDSLRMSRSNRFY